MSSLIEVRVPDMGNFDSVSVIDVLVKPGDSIDIDTPLVTLETDKATMDVPSTARGVVEKVHVAKGGYGIHGRAGGHGARRGSAVGACREARDCVGTDRIAGARGQGAGGRRSPAKEGPVEVRVPDMGNFDSVSVIEVMVKPGDNIDFDTPLATLETDKATMDVPSTAKGVVEKVHVTKGGTVGPGALVVTVKGLVLRPRRLPRQPPRQTRRLTNPPLRQRRHARRRRRACRSRCPARGGMPAIDEASFGSAHASPSVRKFARELGVNLGSVKGSGDKGRILADDVKAFVKLVMSGGVALAAPAPALPKAHNYDPAAFGEVEVKPLNRVQKISGPRLQAAWINIPHVTQFDESDITDLEKLRGSLKEKAADCGRQAHAAGVHRPGRGARHARIPDAQQPAG